MQTLTVERTIAAPIEHVFDWMSDPARYRASFAVLRCEWTHPGVDDKHGVGARRKVTWLFGECVERVTSFEPPYRMSYVAESSFPDIRHEGTSITFTEVPGGTRVRWRTTGEAAIPIAANFVFRQIGFPVLEIAFNRVLDTLEVALTSRRREPLIKVPSCLQKQRNQLFDLYLKGIRNTHDLGLKLSGGRWGYHEVGMTFVRLHVRGRKSGAWRDCMLTAPLIDENRVILVASKEGEDRNPQWYWNLVANPDIRLTIDGAVSPWRARTATPEEKSELWPEIVKRHHTFAVYQTRTERDIPVVICEPREPSEIDRGELVQLGSAH